MHCPSCAAPVPAGARFCSSCGHSVAVATAEERRIVTVLFGDVVGFTTLAERRDPEQVKRIIDGAFEGLVEVVTSFGGRVDKLLGDGILALFGAPVAHEDDAERAVRAGLRMQEVLAHYVEEADLDHSLRMRIGINTGEVLVGTLAGTDYTAMGDVVNTASRLQAEAPPGGVLVGEATHALTDAVIEYGPETKLLPRGREQSVSTWLAVDTLTAPGARLRRTDLRLVGRDAELMLARAALSLGVRERRSLLLNVVGESGVGKSRLIDELLDTLDDVDALSALVLEGACAPYGESNVWSPIAGAIASHLDFDVSMSVEQIRERATAKAAKLFAADVVTADVERVVEVFVHLLGHPSVLDALDPPIRRDAVHHGITKVIEHLADRSPLLLWIDDLHWADEVVIDLLRHLIGSIQRLPFIVITSMRPGSDVLWPPATDRATVLSLTVQPLARADSDELALELLSEMPGDSSVDQRLLGALFDRSGGNPLFLQQLAGVVAEHGPSSELPDSLRALIAARLDQLSPIERQVLDNAATLGLSGSITSLERFGTKMQQPFERAIVSQLDAKGFLLVEGGRWRFRSDSVRETAYQTLTKQSRAQRHAGVYASMSAHAPTALDDIAHHSAAAAELVSEIGAVEGVPLTIRSEAVEALAMAAHRARDSGSHRLTVRHATRAIDLMTGHPSEEATRTQLVLLRAAGLIELRDWSAARADLDVLLERAVIDADVATEGAARRLLGSMHHQQGDPDGARAELGRSVELLRETEHTALLADALRQRGVIELFGGSPTDAEWFFGEAEAEYRALDDERGLAYIEQHRAWLSFLSGDLELADARLHSAAETHSRLGDRNGVGWAFGLLAFVRFFQRRFDDAEDLASVVMSEAAERGDDWAAAMMLTLMADLRLWQGQLEAALTSAEQARTRFRRLGDKFGMVQALVALVRTQVALGRTGGVQRTTEELMSLSEGSPAGPVPLLAVAGAAMHRGDGQLALATARDAEAFMLHRGTVSFELSVLLAISALQVGEIDQALAAIDDIPPEAMVHPFARVGAALVHSLTGDAEQALADAAVVGSTSGSSYLDRALAAIAAAGAHVSRHDPSAASEVLDDAIAECVQVGDVVAIALLLQAHLHLVGEAHRLGEGDVSALGSGWVHVLEALAALEPAA